MNTALDHLIETELDRPEIRGITITAVSYTHLRAHETVLDLVCRLLLENKKDMDSLFHVE